MAIITAGGRQTLSFDEKEEIFLAEAEPLRSEPRGYAPEQMVRCEVCLRANPPTRTTCLYCAAGLPQIAANASLQRPTLRKLEKWEHGFNVILLPESAASLMGAAEEVAQLLHLTTNDLKRLVETGVPVPVARAATSAEAALVQSMLAERGAGALVVGDEDLLLNDSAQRRARAFELRDDELVLRQSGDGETWALKWDEIVLLVAGRLFVRQVETEERRGRKAEGELVDARELSADEAVLDIYTAQKDGGWRITSGSFDFSCLGARKGLIAAQNFSTLTGLLRERAGRAAYDDSYLRLRSALGIGWPLEQHTEARGWRRERPGRVHTEAVTTSDNELQFTRYSRLRHYLKLHHTELSA